MVRSMSPHCTPETPGTSDASTPGSGNFKGCRQEGQALPSGRTVRSAHCRSEGPAGGVRVEFLPVLGNLVHVTDPPLSPTVPESVNEVSNPEAVMVFVHGASRPTQPTRRRCRPAVQTGQVFGGGASGGPSASYTAAVDHQTTSQECEQSEREQQIEGRRGRARSTSLEMALPMFR